MTIAVCFLTPEGVVLGADSTTSYAHPGGGQRFLNHAQKVFQVDDGGTLAFATAGNASIGVLSYRTLVARLGDRFRDPSMAPKTVLEAANAWADLAWSSAQTQFAADITKARALEAQKAAGAPALTPEEETHLKLVKEWSAIYFLGGRNISDRLPGASQVVLRLLDPRPVPIQVPFGWSMAGATELPLRLLKGWTEPLINAVTGAKDANGAPRWTGSATELESALASLELQINPGIPIREAVDFVHLIVNMTTKGVKFAQLPPVVGGPTEVAVITTDRPLRWVKHKPFDAAI